MPAVRLASRAGKREGGAMILWFCLTKNERDGLRLFQQSNYPGAAWSEPGEPDPPRVKPVEEEVSKETVKVMTAKPNTTAEARA